MKVGRRFILGLIVLGSMLGSTMARAQYGAAPPGGPGLDNSVPPEMEGVDIVEHLDETLPLDTMVIDDTGKPVALGSFFQGQRPVILTLNYYTCPMLCTLTLNGLVDALKNIDFEPGKDFTWVNVSINPKDSPELAAVKARNYELVYERPEAARGIHFMVAEEEKSRRIADAVGYGYRYDERSGEYVHASAIFLCTPDGRISRYFYGVKFDPSTLRLGLLEASEGKIGTTVDRFILWCHQFDPKSGSYSLAAFRLMQLGGLLTLVVMGGGFAMMWRKDLLGAKAAGEELGEGRAAPTH